MKLLADENIHGDIVAWLRENGQDVLYIADTRPGSPDEEVLALANAEHRTLVTDDKDFGELVYRRRLVAHGVVLIRLTAPDVRDRINRLAVVWPFVERHQPGRFAVIGDKKVRIRALTTP